MKNNDLPKGVSRITRVPTPELSELWDSIVIDQATKRQLLSQGVVNFTVRPKVPRTVLPLHGVILLVGAPGTGKTSLARGLASELGKVFKNEQLRLVEIEPHSLMSSAMGKTQRAVLDLFSVSIAELAATGPIVVLLDEVETLAADRTKLSLEANPIDVHRATDAVLVQLDALADQHPNLLFVATSNFPQAIDAAFTSRSDLVLNVPLPSTEACQQILSSTLEGMSAAFPKLEKLARSEELVQCARACVGLDGRTIRKTVASALAFDREVALDPNKLSMRLLNDAIALAKSRKEIHR